MRRLASQYGWRVRRSRPGAAQRSTPAVVRRVRRASATGTPVAGPRRERAGPTTFDAHQRQRYRDAVRAPIAVTSTRAARRDRRASPTIASSHSAGARADHRRAARAASSATHGSGARPVDRGERLQQRGDGSPRGRCRGTPRSSAPGCAPTARAAGDAPPRQVDAVEQVALRRVAGHELEVVGLRAAPRRRAEPLALVHAAAGGRDLGVRLAEQRVVGAEVDRQLRRRRRRARSPRADARRSRAGASPATGVDVRELLGEALRVGGGRERLRGEDRRGGVVAVAARRRWSGSA